MASMLERLRQAIQTGDVADARSVIEADPAIVNGRSEDNQRTPLHTLSDYPGHRLNGLEIAQLLIDNGADVDARFQHPEIATSRETPLHWAASNNDLDLAALLLDAGAQIDIDGGVIDNGTPLWDATIFAAVQVCNLLIDRGAQSNLMSACAAGRLDLVDGYFDDAGNVKPEAGAFPNREARPVDVALDAALGFACACGHASLARRLLERGANPNWESLAGNAVTRAKEAAHGVIVDFLAERGFGLPSDPNA